MKRLHWILLLMILLIPTESISAKKKTEKSDREIWCDVMYRMAAPVLSNMSEGLLKQNMLVELSPTWDGRNQNVTSYEFHMKNRRSKRRQTEAKVSVIKY